MILLSAMVIFKSLLHTVHPFYEQYLNIYCFGDSVRFVMYCVFGTDDQ